MKSSLLLIAALLLTTQACASGNGTPHFEDGYYLNSERGELFALRYKDDFFTTYFTSDFGLEEGRATTDFEEEFTHTAIEVGDTSTATRYIVRSENGIQVRLIINSDAARDLSPANSETLEDYQAVQVDRATALEFVRAQIVPIPDDGNFGTVENYCQGAFELSCGEIYSVE